MSYLNKQNVKARALEVAQYYAPHKVRYSPRFTNQLEKLVDLVLVQMVKDQKEDQRQGIYESDWATDRIEDADRKHSIYYEKENKQE